jgi:CRISPR-associated protein Csd2
MNPPPPNGMALPRATGLLVIEALNSNPNGDPDREGDPRQRPDGRGEISPVSFKRKLRDLVANKEGPVWAALAQELGLEVERFRVLESAETKGGGSAGAYAALKQEAADGVFTGKYWDARLFGHTTLEALGPGHVKTGVVQFGVGLSVAPIDIARQTTTSRAGVQEGKDRGMAPLAYRVVRHAVYCMPFFVNPSAAARSGCTRQDLDLMLRLIPYAYPHARSYLRPSVEVRHAWYIEHRSPLGSCSDFALLKALTPRKRSGPDRPSTAWEDYDVPAALPEELGKRVRGWRDVAEV